MSPWDELAEQALQCYCGRTDGGHNCECPAYARECVARLLCSEWSRGAKLSHIPLPNGRIKATHS